MSYTKQVHEFANAAAEAQGKELPAYPVELSPEAVNFIRKMVNDEMDELAEARSVSDQADALVDAIYYICDTACKHGINLDPLFEIVHSANMRKMVDGKVIICQEGERKGKIEKPEGWYPADKEFGAEISRQIGEGGF